MSDPKKRLHERGKCRNCEARRVLSVIADEEKIEIAALLLSGLNGALVSSDEFYNARTVGGSDGVVEISLLFYSSEWKRLIQFVSSIEGPDKIWGKSDLQTARRLAQEIK